MSSEPESLMLHLLREMRAEIGAVRAETASIRAEMATEDELAELRSEINSFKADVASDIAVLHKETTEQIAGLRCAVVEYHTSVIGHGILISELEARMRRVEQHLNLPAIDTH